MCLQGVKVFNIVKIHADLSSELRNVDSQYKNGFITAHEHVVKSYNAIAFVAFRNKPAGLTADVMPIVDRLHAGAGGALPTDMDDLRTLAAVELVYRESYVMAMQE